MLDLKKKKMIETITYTLALAYVLAATLLHYYTYKQYRKEQEKMEYFKIYLNQEIRKSISNDLNNYENNIKIKTLRGINKRLKEL